MSSESQEQVSLPFSPEMQDAILGHLLMNEKFFLKCKGHILSDWFVDPNCQRIWIALTEYHTRYGKFPTKPALMDAREIKLESQAKQNVISSKIETAKYCATNYPIEQIQDQLTEWMHVRFFIEGQKTAQKLFNQKQLPKAFSAMEHTLQNIRDTKFDGYEPVDFSDINKLLEDDNANTEGALSSGLTLFDQLLLPKAKGRGAFLPGQSTVVMAPINAGKTAFMVTIAIHNVKRGKHVLYIMHEGDATQMVKRFICAFLEKTDDEIEMMRKTENGQEQFKNAEKWLKRFLTFISYNKTGMNLEDCLNIIKQEQMKKQSVNQTGKGFDLIIDDYPELLPTNDIGLKKWEQRGQIAYAYRQFTALAAETRAHVLVAAQPNREGGKIGKNMGKQNRLLVMEDVGEAYGIAQQTFNMITLTRPPDAIRQNLIYLHCAKSRSCTRPGWTVVAKEALYCGITHKDEYGATAYYGIEQGTERMGQLIDTYNGNMIPNGTQL